MADILQPAAPQGSANPFIPNIPTGQGSLPLNFYNFPGQLPGLGNNNPFGFGNNDPSYTTNINPYTGAGRALTQDLSKAGFGASASGILSGLVSSNSLFDPIALNELQGLIGQAPGVFGGIAGRAEGLPGMANSLFSSALGTTESQFNNAVSNITGLANSADSIANINFGKVQDQSTSGYQKQIQNLQDFVKSGSGYNPQIAQMLFASMQPQINQQMRDISERYGAGGLASSSSGATGLADYLGQVNANQQAINANLYQQSIQNYLSAMGLQGSDLSQMLGINLGAAQGIQSQVNAGLTDVAGADIARAQGVSGAAIAKAQGVTQASEASISDLLNAAQGMFGTELGGISEFGNLFQTGNADLINILQSTQRNKQSGIGSILGGIGSLVGGLGGLFGSIL